ncbi:hypothetical protein ACQKP0_08170 [Heyndrickxia sp. NPDC080065]|uniref:hypothetical protein n=1 Tax=Heyndrickxia sp. NPDC080065 TaxID=3390568 RepID=UPI003CFBC68D
MKYLFISMILAGGLGIILIMFEPIFAGLLAFGIVGGCIFRGVFLLEKINKKLTVLVPDKNKVIEAYEKYKDEKGEI